MSSEPVQMRPQRLLTQGEIETEIVKLSDALEDATIRFANLAERSATVEADFKLAYYRSLLKAIGFGDRKMTVHEREAQAHTACAEAFRTRLIYEARVDAARQGLSSLRTRIEALRTLAANVRQQT